jgi:DNA-binding NarL/FixJ family response regulator
MLDNSQCVATNVVDLSEFSPALHKIRILLIGQQELFVDALRALIEEDPGFSVVGMAPEPLPQTVTDISVDVILVDLASGAAQTLDLLPELIQAAEGARVLVLTDSADADVHLRAVRLGAMGGLSRAESATVLFKAIRAVYSGEIWMDRALLRAALQGKPIADKEEKNQSETARRIADVTARERDVIALICEGRKNREIADSLFISECTVRHHLTSIFDKLGVENRLELLLFAQEHNLINRAAMATSAERRAAHSQARATSIARVAESVGAAGPASSD